jgi:hypothetical protein
MEERTRALVGECISRAHVEAARGASLGDIEAACAACDYERAATLVLGRAKAGDTVPVDLVARVLPGIELPAITLALVASVKEDRARLIELLERRRFPQVRDAGDLEAIVLFAAWKAGAEIGRVKPELRRLAARVLSANEDATLPWHRVVRADGRIAFPPDSKGFREQQRRLRAEGVRVTTGRVRMPARATPDLDAEIWR